MKKKRIYHPFDPVFDENSKILILGSIASEKSRELGFPYANPQNRFWKVMGILFQEEIVDYKQFLLKHNIALWDVVKTCEIEGSSDSSITNIEVNDIGKVLKNHNISAVFTNGKKATALYKKYLYEKTKIESIYLPSTSPANATSSLEKLVEDYRIILEHLS